MNIGSHMHVVGHHLQMEAIGAPVDDRDAFARSAFNRYYYSAFLTIRAMLRSLDPAWSSLSHASYPEVLRGKVLKSFRESKKRAKKNDDGALVRKIERAERSIYELAKIMTTAYGVRVVADYEPEEQVSFDGNPRFALRAVGISDAHDWENNARLLCRSIESVWNEIYG